MDVVDCTHQQISVTRLVREPATMTDLLTREVISPAAARRYAARRRQFDSRRIYVRPRTGPQSAHLWWPARCRHRGGSGGVTKVTSHPPWRGSLFHVIIMRVTKSFRCRFVPLLYTFRRPNSQMLKFYSPVSPDSLDARWLRSLGFPSKNPRSANEAASAPMA